MVGMAWPTWWDRNRYIALDASTRILPRRVLDDGGDSSGEKSEDRRVEGDSSNSFLASEKLVDKRMSFLASEKFVDKRILHVFDDGGDSSGGEKSEDRRLEGDSSNSFLASEKLFDRCRLMEESTSLFSMADDDRR
jgi:hypothetical protein